MNHTDLDQTTHPAAETVRRLKQAQLAEEILTLARNRLLVNLRFLDAALSRFVPVPADYGRLFTQGSILFYHPPYLLRAFKEDQAVPVRDYLHLVLHCVFRHMAGAAKLQQNLWDLSCDIAVEASISGLQLKETAAGRQAYQEETVRQLQKAVGPLTAERLYRYFRQSGLSNEKLQRLAALFRGDDHDLWYDTGKKSAALLARSGKLKNDGLVKSGSGIATTDRLEQSADQSSSDTWKEIAEKMQIDLTTFSRKYADAADTLLQNLTEIHRETYDYSAFLKKFATRRELLKVNDDEFDYIYYTYGLNLYGKMPLIEPLEYKEDKKIRDLVVAIDTSGSGPTVQGFVQKTWNILKSTENFFSKINLHIIQCDAVIQEHVKITDQAAFDRYIRRMKIKGLGGTDFRPVFRLVNTLAAQKEFTDLRGLIYFTDGNGRFPERKPDYTTAFVYLENEGNNRNLPPWIIRQMLSNDDCVYDPVRLPDGVYDSDLLGIM